MIYRIHQKYRSTFARNLLVLYNKIFIQDFVMSDANSKLKCYVSKLHIVINMKFLREKMNIFFCWYGHIVCGATSNRNTSRREIFLKLILNPSKLSFLLFCLSSSSFSFCWLLEAAKVGPNWTYLVCNQKTLPLFSFFWLLRCFGQL